MCLSDFIFQEINEEWLSDKSRFACDGLKRQRLITPMIKSQSGEFVAAEWEDALIYVSQRLRAASGNQVAGIAGGLADAESMVALKDLVNKLGSENVCTEHAFPTDGSGIDLRSSYLLNSTIAGIELFLYLDWFKSDSSVTSSFFLFPGVEDADLILLIGTNPRFEAPLFNARIRKAYINTECNVALIGPQVDLTYDYTHLGEDASIVKQIGDGRHDFWKVLNAAKRPLVVVGADQLKRSDGASILATVQHLCKKLNSNVKVCNSQFVNKIEMVNTN